MSGARETNMMQISDEVANGISAFDLTWAIMLALLRKGILSRDDIITALNLAADKKSKSAVIPELIKALEKLPKDLKPH
jgi:hypothetical protein